MSDGHASGGRAGRRDVAALLAGRRVCICVGAGGVGKTTSAAAIARGMAARGQKVCVVTIDPARRLADALGLDQLDNRPRRVQASGELWAMMLDPKLTFDELIDRVAPDAQRARQIKENAVYRELSSAVSGSQEFTAIDKLYELVQDDYDLIVLDTPPAHNAAEFLSAPGRLGSFLGGGALRALLRPSGLGMRLLGIGATPALAALKLVTGADLFTSLATFFMLLGPMTDEFNARAARVQSLLRSQETGFLLVTSAQERPLGEVARFRARLEQEGMTVLGVVVNRVHERPDGDEPERVRSELELALPGELAAAVCGAVADAATLAERDAANIGALEHALAGAYPLLTVPDFSEAVSDGEGLALIERALFGGGRGR